MNESRRPIAAGDVIVPGVFALMKFLFHLPVLNRYGYHHDELYFIACGQHPAFGYVDHSPMTPWIARLAQTLFGDSLFGLRLFPLLAGTAALFLTGLLVRRLGGGRFAQALACLAMLMAPVYLRSGNMLCIPAFEPFFWVIGFYLLVRIVQEDNPRLWLGVGLVAGLGLMNKHSMLFFGFGLVVALALTSQRKHFRSPWLYAGGLVAALVFLPNIVWQSQNDWATLVFLRGLNEGTMSEISPVQFIIGQLLYLGPFAPPLWITGLCFLLFSKAGKPYAMFGYMYVAVFLLLILIASKIYYLAPAYPVLFAAGAIAIEGWASRPRRAWLRPASAAVVFAGGAALAPLSVPILSLPATEKYIAAATFGALGNVYELTGDLRGMFGWQERADAIAKVYDTLSEEEKAKTVIYTGSYGLAGAVDLFGDSRGLPNAVSGHMTFHLWGLPDHPIENVIMAYISQEAMDYSKKNFESVEVASSTEIYPNHVDPDELFRVYLCRGARVDLHDDWKDFRDWE